MIHEDILATIGRTPVVRLRNVLPRNGSEILVKLEGSNPGGSIKDRAAAFIIAEAERRGELRPNGTIIESTSGNFGKALALIGATRGYRVILVVDPKAPSSMIRFSEACGAVIEMIDVPDEDGGYQRPRIRRVKELLSKIPGAFWPNQYENPDNRFAHERFTAEEIVTDVGYLDALVAAVSTGGHISGLSAALRQRFPELETVAVDAVGSSIFGYGFQHYLIRGIGLAWTPKNLRSDVIDRVHRVSDGEAIGTARILARHEGLLLGESAGAAVFAGLHHAHAHAGARVVVIAPDGATNYIDESFDDRWLAARGLGDSFPNSVAELLEAIDAPSHSPVQLRRPYAQVH